MMSRGGVVGRWRVGDARMDEGNAVVTLSRLTTTTRERRRRAVKSARVERNLEAQKATYLWEALRPRAGEKTGPVVENLILKGFGKLPTRRRGERRWRARWSLKTRWMMGSNRRVERYLNGFVRCAMNRARERAVE